MATARSTDLLSEAEQAQRRAIANNPKLKPENAEMGVEIYRRWMNDLEPVLAIVWKRCRHLVDG